MDKNSISGILNYETDNTGSEKTKTLHFTDIPVLGRIKTSITGMYYV